jgi:hypothetical protein
MLTGLGREGRERRPRADYATPGWGGQPLEASAWDPRGPRAAATLDYERDESDRVPGEALREFLVS